MKTYHITFLAAFILLAAPACQDEVANAQRSDHFFQEIPVSDDDCSPWVEERNTVDTYKNERGVLKQLPIGRNDSQLFLAPERMSKYMYSDLIQVCNWPDSILSELSEGDEIMFSGELKEVYPTENMPGNPFKLTGLKVKIKRDSPPLSVE
jgi:hypothetical protein